LVEVERGLILPLEPSSAGESMKARTAAANLPTDPLPPASCPQIDFVEDLLIKGLRAIAYNLLDQR